MIGRAALIVLALAATRDDPLAGRVAGPMAQCIDLDRVQGPDIVDNHTMLYRQSLKRVWRAELAGACPSLDRFSIPVVEVQGRRMCRNDRFRVRSTSGGVLSGYCRFAGFTPFDRP